MVETIGNGNVHPDLSRSPERGEIFLPRFWCHPWLDSLERIDWWGLKREEIKDGKRILCLGWKGIESPVIIAERGIVFTEAGLGDPHLFASVNPSISGLRLVNRSVMGNFADWVSRPDNNGDLWQEIRECGRRNCLVEEAVAKISLLVYFQRRGWQGISRNGWKPA